MPVCGKWNIIVTHIDLELTFCGTVSVSKIFGLYSRDKTDIMHADFIRFLGPDMFCVQGKRQTMNG